MPDKGRWLMRFGGRRCTWRVSSRSFLLLLFYTVFIWCCELLDFLCWLAGMPQTTAVSRLTALLMAALLMFYVIGLPKREKNRTDLFFMAGCAFIFVFFAVKGIRPDMSYDTQNYHLLSQIPGFADNIHYHVIPGRFQMFGFRLGDRLFYPFRILLGLRMGTLFNAVVMLVLYRQTTAFLAWFERRVRPDRQSSLFISWPSVLAFFIVSRFELIQESGSYMVELAALPFLVEMVFLLVRDRDGENTFCEACVFCLLGGILFCLKMTNIVYLAPLVILYLIKIRKSVTPAMFAVCLAAGIIPVTIYLGYNGISTGNPVYPYYNTFFKSPYYSDVNFKDPRWGPQSALEILLWPLYMIFFPGYRLSEIWCEFNWDLAVVLAAAAVVAADGIRAIAGGRNIVYRQELRMAVLLGCSIFAWTVSTGHIRYYMGGLVIGGIMAAFLFLRMIYCGRSVRKAAALFLAVPFLIRAEYGYQSVWQGNEWAMRDGNMAAYRENIPFVFRDRQLFSDEALDKIDRIYLTWGDYGSYARLAGDNIPVWNRYSITNELSSFRAEYEEEIRQAMENGEGVYDMFPQGREVLDEYLAWMNEAGFYVSDLFYLDTILKGVQSYTLAGLELADGRKNTWYYGDWAQDSPGFSFEKKSDHCVLSVIAADPDWWILPALFEVEVTASDGKTEKTAAVVTVGDREYRRMDIDLDLTGLEGMVELTFKSRTQYRKAVMINPEWR